jgi:hypothetical protein
MRIENTSVRQPRPINAGDSKIFRIINLPSDEISASGVHSIAALRDYGCRLSIATLSAVTKQSKHQLQARTRCSADVAFARQIAMYLAHTKFGISYVDVGDYFHRDRTTVAHACQLVEDRRDDREFDDHLTRMECLMDAALPQTAAIQRLLFQKTTGAAQ